jgi:hypothetical protein
MDLRSKMYPARKNEIKTSPPPFVFQFFLTTVWTESRTQCALSSGDDDGTIYIKITAATGAGDAAMPVATMIPSSNGLDDVTYDRCYYDWALLSVTYLPVPTHSLGEQIMTSS